jgi:hypothetical protein
MDPTFLVEWSRVQHQDPIVSVLRSTAGVAIDVRVPKFYAPMPELIELGRDCGIQSMTVISTP